jgi:putative transposase
MVRASLNYVNWKQRVEVAADLKTIYRAPTEAEAEQRLKDFSEKWDGKYPSISALWRRNWLGIVPFFQFAPEIRKIVYTTNAIESLNMSLRKAIKTRGAFPTEDAALKVMYLALKNLAAKWHAVQGWREALNQFAQLTNNETITRSFTRNNGHYRRGQTQRYCEYLAVDVRTTNSGCA